MTLHRQTIHTLLLLCDRDGCDIEDTFIGTYNMPDDTEDQARNYGWYFTNGFTAYCDECKEEDL